MTKKVRRLRTTILVTLSVGIIAILTGVLGYNRFIATTTVIEDINNNCGDKGLSTAATPRLVYKEVPNYQVDQYLKEARSENRCAEKQ
jgi:hypothetical protein